MTKTKNTRRALLISLLTMTLSFVMLIGTTFAWFTDTVSSGNNKIVAGNLDVEVTHTNNKVTNEALDKEGAKLFPVELWEPGVVSYETFTVKNAGSLAFNYTFNLTVADFNTVKDTDKSLKDVIKLGVLEGSVEGKTREQLVAAVKAVEAKEDSIAMNFTNFSDFSFEDSMQGETTSKTFTMVAYWEPTENDDDYNMNGNKTVSKPNGEANQLYIDIVVNVFATQAAFESDSFDKNYDASIKVGVIFKDSETTLKISNDVAITISAESVDKNVNAVFSVQLIENIEYAQTYEISLKDSNSNSITLNVPAMVTINAGKNKEIAGVKHSGVAMMAAASSTEMMDGTYYYDSETGILTICTSSFSPFEVEWKQSQADIVSKLVEEGYVAVSGEADFKKAIAAGKPIVLTGNVDTAYASDVAKVPLYFNDSNADVVLDLNGYTIDAGEKVGTQIPRSMVINAGKVTIVDTYGGGEIKDTIWVSDAGNLTIENVNVENVSVTNNAKLTINGGKFTKVSSTGSVDDVEITVNDGTFDSLSCASAKATIYGGTFKELTGGKASYTIYGGTFENLPSGGSTTATIYGGYFKNAGSFNNNITWKVYGGTFERTSAIVAKFLAEGKTCVNNGDGTWSVKDA